MIARTAYRATAVQPLAAGGDGRSAWCVVWLVPPSGGARSATGWHAVAGLLGWVAMGVAYAPTLRRFRLSFAWAPFLPLVAAFYTAATIGSAADHMRKDGVSCGKGGLTVSGTAGRPPYSRKAARPQPACSQERRGVWGDRHGPPNLACDVGRSPFRQGPQRREFPGWRPHRRAACARTCTPSTPSRATPMTSPTASVLRAGREDRAAGCDGGCVARPSRGYRQSRQRWRCARAWRKPA